MIPVSFAIASTQIATELGPAFHGPGAAVSAHSVSVLWFIANVLTLDVPYMPSAAAAAPFRIVLRSDVHASMKDRLDSGEKRPGTQQRLLIQHDW